jgi:Putative TOS1-like glycosyl hydrolase (DUF2401)
MRILSSGLSHESGLGRRIEGFPNGVQQSACPNDVKSVTNTNMPAVWILNGKMVRTQQYGAFPCWADLGGCGEFDIMDALAPKEYKLKSTFHGNPPVEPTMIVSASYVQCDEDSRHDEK